MFSGENYIAGKNFTIASRNKFQVWLHSWQPKSEWLHGNSSSTFPPCPCHPPPISPLSIVIILCNTSHCSFQSRTFQYMHIAVTQQFVDDNCQKQLECFFHKSASIVHLLMDQFTFIPPENRSHFVDTYHKLRLGA